MSTTLPLLPARPPATTPTPQMTKPAPTNTQNVAGRTAIGATWLVAWRLVTRALGLLSTLVLARLLVPADFGLIAMATTFTAAIDALSGLGVAEALVRSPETGQRWYPTAFTFQAVRGLATAAFIALAASTAGTWFHEPRLEPILFILAAMSALSGLENIGIVEFRRNIQFGMEFKLLFIPRILQFTTTITLAFVLQSYWALIAGIVVSGTARFVMTYVVHPYRPRLSLAHWRDLLGFSAWIWAGGLATLVWERCDAVVLGPAMGSGPLGVYLLAAEISILPLTELVSPGMRALYSGISAARSQGTAIASLALSVTAAILLIVLPLSIGLSATSGYIVAGLLGPKWEAARPMIATFAWLCCAAPASVVCSTILNAQGQVRRTFFATALSSATRVVIMLIIVATNNLDQAPLIGVLATLAEAIYFLTQLRGHGDLRWRDNLGGAFRLTLSTIATTAALIATGLGWQPVTLPAIPALLEGGLIGLATIATFLLIQTALWTIAGRPPGPERHVIDLARNAYATRRAKTPGTTPAESIA